MKKLSSSFRMGLVASIPLFVVVCIVLVKNSNSSVSNFAQCVAKGSPVMESYPRQCRENGKTFVEAIGNAPEKADIIYITSPLQNQVVQSPLVISGEARGNWFFEASFPVIIADKDGLIIAEGVAHAKSDWMTTNFVPFEATLTFSVGKASYGNIGTLILRKDNPSGLAELDDALEVPVIIQGTKL